MTRRRKKLRAARLKRLLARLVALAGLDCDGTKRGVTITSLQHSRSGRLTKSDNERVSIRSKLLVPTLAGVVLSVAACGTGSSSPATGPSRSATSGSAVAKGAGPIRIYRLRLTGAAKTPPGAPSGAGEAVIALHNGSVVCWRFVHLHGFTNAKPAHIQLGANAKAGPIVASLSAGPRLHHRGCVHVSPTQIKALEHDPHAYYVSIPSDQYPAGAVGAQL